MQDMKGNEVLVGCELSSAMHPSNEVKCVVINKEGTHLKQNFKGAASFIMPEHSQWVVTKQPEDDD